MAPCLSPFTEGLTTEGTTPEVILIRSRFLTLGYKRKPLGRDLLLGR